jgi:hypothetical protein
MGSWESSYCYCLEALTFSFRLLSSGDTTQDSGWFRLAQSKPVEADLNIMCASSDTQRSICTWVLHDTPLLEFLGPSERLTKVALKPVECSSLLFTGSRQGKVQGQ